MSESDPVHGHSETTATTDGLVGLMVGQEAVDDPPTPSELHTLQSAVSETSAIDQMSESDPVHGDSETTATNDGPVVGLMVGQEAVDDPPTPSELHTLQSAVSETSAIDQNVGVGPCTWGQ